MATKSSTRARPGRDNLSSLIAKFKAANAAYGAAAIREDKADNQLRRLSPVDKPKAVGGLTNSITLVVGGRTQEIPASEFYYRSHEEIDRAMNDKAGKANNGTERRAISADRKRLHAELDRDASRIAAATVRSVPRAVITEARRAEAALTKASNAFTAAHANILAYRPTRPVETAALLDFVAREMVNFNGDADASRIMRNAAKSIMRTVTR